MAFRRLGDKRQLSRPSIPIIHESSFGLFSVLTLPFINIQLLQEELIMRKGLQMCFGIILLLFLSPILINTFTTIPQKYVIAQQPEPDKEPVAVTVATRDELISINEQIEYKNALLLFTHSHEAFVPIVQNENGQTAVYSPTSNIMDFEDTIKNHFALNFIQTEFLAVDTMNEMKKTNRTFSEAYAMLSGLFL